MFIERWKEGRYAMLRQAFEDLFEFYDYLSAPIGNAVSGNIERMDEYGLLLKRFSPQANANPWNRMIEPKRFPPTLPHRTMELDAEGTGTELLFTDYATLLNWHEHRTKMGLEEFDNFVQRYRTGPTGV